MTRAHLFCLWKVIAKVVSIYQVERVSSGRLWGKSVSIRVDLHESGSKKKQRQQPQQQHIIGSSLMLKLFGHSPQQVATTQHPHKPEMPAGGRGGVGAWEGVESGKGDVQANSIKNAFRL